MSLAFSNLQVTIFKESKKYIKICKNECMLLNFYSAIHEVKNRLFHSSIKHNLKMYAFFYNLNLHFHSYFPVLRNTNTERSYEFINKGILKLSLLVPPSGMNYCIKYPNSNTIPDG